MRQQESYKIVGELPEVPSPDCSGIGRRIQAYVLVNHRSKGKAPFTIQALVDMVQAIIPAPA